MDNNVIILSFIFIFERFFVSSVFHIYLRYYDASSAFNLAPIRTYKFGAKWFYVLVAYTIIISTYFCGFNDLAYVHLRTELAKTV